MAEDPISLDADDTWLCSHVDAAGAPVASTRLRLSDTHDWPRPVYNARRWLNCPDCGTRWRAWAESRQVKPTVYWHGRDPRPGAYRYRHSPLNDFDALLNLIRTIEPDVMAYQFENAWPADDDGLWTVHAPGAKRSVQIEASRGRCPFLVEGELRRTGRTVEEAARYVFDELHRDEA